MKTLLIVVVVLVVMAVLKQKLAGGLPMEQALDLHQQGARLIDVRTEAEYRQSHLDQAVNIPLDQLETAIGHHAPDKDTPLLLHCASGARSGVATAKLKHLGYKQAHNLGGYAAARRFSLRLSK